MKKQKNTLTKEAINHIAHLARLTLSSEELTKYQSQLSSVLDYINIISTVDTTVTQPTSQVNHLENVYRDDIVRPSLTQKEALSNAKKTHNGFFVIEAIFEE